jgi:hypothetical protein
VIGKTLSGTSPRSGAQAGALTRRSVSAISCSLARLSQREIRDRWPDSKAKPCRARGRLHLARVTARWPYVLVFTAGPGAWAALFWSLRRQGGPISFVERQLAHVWGSGIVAINLVFLVEWLLGLPVLSLITMIAVTNGMLFMVKAGILSGFYYFQAAVILAILPMAWFPRFTPMIFGTVAVACFFLTGLKYRLRRQRSEP